MFAGAKRTDEDYRTPNVPSPTHSGEAANEGTQQPRDVRRIRNIGRVDQESNAGVILQIQD